MANLPSLYKKTSTGAIQYWTVFVTENPDHSTGFDICTEYGQVGTPNPQKTHDSILEGKNVGKKNETTPEQQAIKEAKSRWEKQKKKGYVESIEAAQADEVDELIEGGVNPMLAQSYSKHAQKIAFPCYIQPKLDGIRCIAVITDGKATLWSRTRKKINSMPHIVSQLEAEFAGYDVVLDGELYNHKFKNNFEEIVSLVRLDEPHPEGKYTDVEYHVYDIAVDKDFNERYDDLCGLFISALNAPHIKPVATMMAANDQEISSLFAEARLQGYEGIMARNGSGKYDNKRSYNLQKVKEFDDAEFEIIGIEEGRGKLMGHVGSFICKTKDGKQFLAKMSGSLDKLKEYFNNESSWKNKQLTVQFQGLTGAEGVPRFPVGLRIREAE